MFGNKGQGRIEVTRPDGNFLIHNFFDVTNSRSTEMSLERNLWKNLRSFISKWEMVLN